MKTLITEKAAAAHIQKTCLLVSVEVECLTHSSQLTGSGWSSVQSLLPQKSDHSGVFVLTHVSQC